MNLQERLQAALTRLREEGYAVREEWLDGQGGGACTLRGVKLFFSDLSLDLFERVAQAEEALDPPPPAHTPPRCER